MDGWDVDELNNVPELEGQQTTVDPEGTGTAGAQQHTLRLEQHNEPQSSSTHADPAPDYDMKNDSEQPDSIQYEQQAASPLQLIQLQKSQYKEWFRQFIAANAGISTDAGQVLDAAALDVDAAFQSADLPELVQSMQQAASAQSYLSSLSYWADSVREVERKVRESQQSAVRTDVQAYAASIYAAIQALSAAIYAGEVSTYYAIIAQQLPQLKEAAATIDSRMQQCRYDLYSRLMDDANQLLQASGWPPPLASKQQQHTQHLPNGHVEGLQNGETAMNNDSTGIDGPAGTHLGDGGDAIADDLNNQQAHHDTSSFQGFDTDHDRFQQLLCVLACLTSLQQAVDKSSFTVSQGDQQNNGALSGQQQQQQQETDAQELPLLWAATCLTAPVQARLQAHFQPHTPAGRLDKPQWLFTLALRLVQDHIGHAAALQPALEACGLAGRCHMAVEWARAMREAAKVVLRTARLPALVELWEDRQDMQACAAWSAYVDAMFEFEAKLAPYLGAPTQQASPGAPAALPAALLSGSVLGAITGEPSFMDTWLAVLQHKSQADLDAAAAEPDAWQAKQDDDDVDGTAPGSAKEFNPPKLAVVTQGLMAHLVDLSQHTPTPDTQRELLDRVGSSLLLRMRSTLIQAIEQADTYSGLTAPGGAPWAGACVSAARYLHHTISEMLTGPALHRLHATQDQGMTGGGSMSGPGAGGSPPQAAADTSEASWSRNLPPGHLLTPRSTAPSYRVSTPALSTQPSPLKGLLGDVVVQHSFTPVTWDPPVLAAAVTALGGSHREWCLRLARELAMVFGKSAVAYRSAVEAAVQYPTHEGAAGTVSPKLLPALTALQAGLSALSGPLDGPSFRDIWRAVAVPINRFLFNYIATEARFTPAGAQQFAVDCAGVVAVFAPYTRRPAAHFRETLASARLLTLPEDYVSEVVRRASVMAVQQQPLFRDTWLEELGLGCLLPAQVVAVVERRM